MRLRGGARVVSLSWGLIDQTFSSATNFGLAVIAGRSAGPGGLGVVYIGFSAYLVALTMQRALVTDPMVVVSTSSTPAARDVAAAHALSQVLIFAVAATALLALLGFLLSPEVGTGLLVFVPWLVGALVQDFWRTVLFRDGRGAAAALNDGVWAATMAMSIPLLLLSHSQWLVVLPWGLGALAGAVLGFRQTRLRPAALGLRARQWAQDSWPLARWLGSEAALLVLQMQVVVFALVAVVGTADVGGLRAVQAVFAPTSLLAQAISFPGLPMLTALTAHSQRQARLWALRLSALGIALVVIYLGVLWIVPRHLLGLLFGRAFDRYDGLIAPTGVLQVVTAGAVGVALLVKAEGRGRALLLNRVVSAVAVVLLTVSFAIVGGITAAAWGMTLGSAFAAVTIVLIAFSRRGQRIGAAPKAMSERTGAP